MSAPTGDPGEEGPVEIPVTGELDLHSFAPREIPAVVRDYVEACRERGIVHLRLVHGRGRGVQRAVVRRVLGSLDGVSAVRDAPPQAGGWGATLAEIVPLARSR
jgi:DNA-nicking Smr family endonuclease